MLHRSFHAQYMNRYSFGSSMIPIPIDSRQQTHQIHGHEKGTGQSTRSTEVLKVQTVVPACAIKARCSRSWAVLDITHCSNSWAVDMGHCFTSWTVLAME